jgi:hypothetical protein
MQPRILTLSLFIACVSATAATNEVAHTPDELAQFYCHSMHEGAFLSTEGIKNVLRVSSPSAERLFEGYGAPDAAYLIESSTVAPRTLTGNRATYDIVFLVRGMLSATSINEEERKSIVDELVIEKNKNGAWEISRFTPNPMESPSSAIRGLKNMRGFYCPPDYAESNEPCSVDQAISRLRKLGANQSFHRTCAKSRAGQ